MYFAELCLFFGSKFTGLLRIRFLNVPKYLERMGKSILELLKWVAVRVKTQVQDF